MDAGEHIRSTWVTVDFEYQAHFRAQGRAPDCEKCHKAHCCRQLALSTEAEAQLIRDTVSRWPEKKRRQLAARLAALPNHARENFQGECPFLVNERCQIYDVRPMACRIFHSMNKSSCKRRKKALDESLFTRLSSLNRSLREWLQEHGASAKVVAMPIWMKYHL